MPHTYTQTYGISIPIDGVSIPTFNGVRKPGTYIACSEKIGSPGAIVSNRDSGATSTRELRVTGTFNRELAIQAVNQWLSANNLFYDRGIPLKSKSLSIDSNGADAFDCTLEYADATNEKWIDEVQITTTGGTAHIETSYDSATYGPCVYGDTLEDTFGKIGVDMEGRPEGVDVKRPNLQINVTLNWGFSAFGSYELNQLLDHTATTNLTTFWGFPTGSLLFEGANIDRVNFSDPYDNTTCYRWKIQYVFSGMPGTWGNDYVVNTSSGQTVGTISYWKEGWDYVWKKYKTTNVNGETRQVLKQVNVEKVYPYYEFRNFGLPSNLFTLDEDIDYSGDTGW